MSKRVGAAFVVSWAVLLAAACGQPSAQVTKAKAPPANAPAPASAIAVTVPLEAVDVPTVESAAVPMHPSAPERSTDGAQSDLTPSTQASTDPGATAALREAKRVCMLLADKVDACAVDIARQTFKSMGQDPAKLTPSMLQEIKMNALEQTTAIRKKCSTPNFTTDDTTRAKVSAARACVAKPCAEFVTCIKTTAGK